MKRAIRQRCGFGCVLCGLPLYEYEHMTDWAHVRVHKEEEITLLCDKHHREKTGGLLPVERVRVADRNPINHQLGSSAPVNLHYSGDWCCLKIGSCWFETDELTCVQARARRCPDSSHISPWVHVSQCCQLLLTLQLFDKFGATLLCIDKNELVYRTDSWDISWVGQVLQIREDPQRIVVELVFCRPALIQIERGHFQLDGYEIAVAPPGRYTY